MTPAPDRKRTYQRGIWAERVAVLYLRLKGYRIRRRRFKCPVGEVDIIAEKGRLVIFVEVKRRRSLSRAAEAVTGRQRRRITRAAEWYLTQAGQGAFSGRFDSILIAPRRWPLHLKNAWPAGEQG